MWSKNEMNLMISCTTTLCCFFNMSPSKNWTIAVFLNCILVYVTGLRYVLSLHYRWILKRYDSSRFWLHFKTFIVFLESLISFCCTHGVWFFFLLFIKIFLFIIFDIWKKTKYFLQFLKDVSIYSNNIQRNFKTKINMSPA